MLSASEAWLAYKLRLRRKRYLLRAWRKRRELCPIINRLPSVSSGAILGFSTVRNELVRLPFFLDHHRALGVDHFAFVVNDSTDGTTDYLRDQPDTSVWTTDASYKSARFGVDWLNLLQHRYAPGHWTLTLDADEILVYPGCETTDLHALTGWFDERRIEAFAALMLDMYPDGPVGAAEYQTGAPIWSSLTHFDGWGYTWERQAKFRNISIRGGPRRRIFFADAPDHAPHLHKVPLLKWTRGMAYASSTHLVLPRRLNDAFDVRYDRPTGVLLHSKFLPDITLRSGEEKLRSEHFTHPARYSSYYDRLTDSPDLMGQPSVRYENTAQLEALGLMRRGTWPG